jgi:hypothetical protein
MEARMIATLCSPGINALNAVAMIAEANAQQKWYPHCAIQSNAADHQTQKYLH